MPGTATATCLSHATPNKLTVTVMQLTTLDIRGCPRACSAQALESLPAMNQLRELITTDCRLQQEAVTTLACISSLQRLDVGDNPGLGGPQLCHLSRLR